MSEVDKELSEGYRALPRDEPPSHVDAAILAAANRAVRSQPLPVGAPRRLRRWYVPVSLAAVIMLSVIVTLQIERERPEIAMPDSVPLAREKAQKSAQQEQEPAAAAPASPPVAAASRVAPKPTPAQPAAPAFAPDPKPARDGAPLERQQVDALRSEDAARGAAASAEAARGNVADSAASGRRRGDAREMAAPVAKPAREALETPKAAPISPPAPAASRPAPKLARDAAPEERQRDDPLAARGPASSGDGPGGNVAGSTVSGRLRSEAREMSAPAVKPAQAPVLAKRELAPEEWLERIAELRRLQRDQEADEQFAEFKRRYPDYRISDTMSERIAPRK